jgi:YjjG family noncanonical pyrimidine nucleotidase
MPGKPYKTLFFDLDHTLWDYETSSYETLCELYTHHQLHKRGVHDLEGFVDFFKDVNRTLWHLYDHGKITSEVIREERFKQILEKFNVHDPELSKNLSAEYLERCPRKGNLMPHATEALDYLAHHYSLTIITNGFDDVQRIKLQAGNLISYFDHIITSQKAGFKKPAKEIFHFALEINQIKSHEAIMIGDNLATDIAGAKNASLDAIFYNPDNLEHETEVKHEIQQLNELCTLL